MAIRERTAGGEARPGWLRLERRSDLVEYLDGGPVETGTLRLNLADLARLNRLPGGVGASLAAVRRLAPGRGPTSVVDVGAGGGDMAVAFARQGWRTVAVDSHPEVLRVARERTAGSALVEVVEANARALPYAQGTFDVSHCSLLLHHLDPAGAVAVLRELSRVARWGVVVNDLRRGVMPLVASALTVRLLGRARVTRLDALTSVRRAYTLRELDQLLAAAGLQVRWRSPTMLPRVVTAAVPRRMSR